MAVIFSLKSLQMSLFLGPWGSRGNEYGGETGWGIQHAGGNYALPWVPLQETVVL